MIPPPFCGPCGCCGSVVLAVIPSSVASCCVGHSLPPLGSLWFWWSCPCGSAPPPCGPRGCSPVVLVVLPPLCERQPVRYCPLSGTDSKAIRCCFPTLRHRGAGSPYTNYNIEHRTSCIGGWTCDTLWYLCCAGDSPPSVVPWFW